MRELARARSVPAYLASVFTAFLLLVAMATAAYAIYPPAEDLSVACTPEEPTGGDTVICTISGAPGDAGLDVAVTLGEAGLLAETVTTDGAGTTDFAFDVPADASAGDQITITVSGDQIDGTLVLSLTVADEVTALGDFTDLADTGAETSTLVLLGLLSAVFGVGALVYGRRRERSRTHS